MTRLSVNLNKIALLRNSREGNYPSLTDHAITCLEAGCHGITIHPRPDQRHIRPGDAQQIKDLLQKWPNAEFNMEGNPFSHSQGSYPGFIQLVLQNKPEQCTLVPDSTDQLTSDHGFNLKHSAEKLAPIIQQLQAEGIRVSLFMDPDLEQIRLAQAIGADRIELYTGPYAAAWGNPEALNTLFPKFQAAAEEALKLGLGLNAGHDLNLDNLGYFKSLPGLLEVSIGHALIVDAIRMGLVTTVQAYLEILAD